MESRIFWHKQLEAAWLHRPIIWLMGVRRVGKTTLCRSLPDIEYLDCELPSTQLILSDPESFLRRSAGKRIVLDEIHCLDRPAQLLKIAADHYPTVKIIATGSSGLGASKKFSDTLAGRKTTIWLSPMLFGEAALFNNSDLTHRFLAGGLPPFFLAPSLVEKDYREWFDAYWAKDIQELFRVEKRFSFLKFASLLLLQSGGIFNASNFSADCEVSRQTINNYLTILEETFIASIVRPFSGRRNSEIVAAPKVYGFDTGFVCQQKGWETLRDDDKGLLWEHLILNELQGQLQKRDICYWRDKQGHEIDFIYSKKRVPITIECKMEAKKFLPDNIKLFRQHYKEGKNFVVVPELPRAFTKQYDGVEIEFVDLPTLIASLKT